MKGWRQHWPCGGTPNNERPKRKHELNHESKFSQTLPSRSQLQHSFSRLRGVLLDPDAQLFKRVLAWRRTLDNRILHPYLYRIRRFDPWPESRVFFGEESCCWPVRIITCHLPQCQLCNGCGLRTYSARAFAWGRRFFGSVQRYWDSSSIKKKKHSLTCRFRAQTVIKTVGPCV